mmetsp:Transcript_74/g.127  ORF Transcript_74/g.127 Transcript_74/m.127 type:complete len:250 (+) Transcript_74:58-807(+)
MTLVLTRSVHADTSRQLRAKEAWSRRPSASDIIELCRAPVRRPFDTAGIAESQLQDVLAVSAPEWVKTLRRPASEPGCSRSRVACSMTPIELRFKQQCLDNQDATLETINDMSTMQMEDSDGSVRPNTQESLLSRPSSRARKARALDFWPSGEGSRIMNHISPKKHRPMSLSGPAHQGFFNQDWSGVGHIQRLRARYPALRANSGTSLGPFPQDISQEEVAMNRNFGRSHGSQKLPKGMMRVGNLVQIL